MRILNRVYAGLCACACMPCPLQAASGWQPVWVDDSLCVVSIGFMTPSRNDAVIWRGVRKNGLIKQFLKDVDWGELEFLVVDAPPGTSDEHITLAQYMKETSGVGAIIVTTPQASPRATRPRDAAPAPAPAPAPATAWPRPSPPPRSRGGGRPPPRARRRPHRRGAAGGARRRWRCWTCERRSTSAARPAARSRARPPSKAKKLLQCITAMIDSLSQCPVAIITQGRARAPSKRLVRT
jgi:hypothetical protein